VPVTEPVTGSGPPEATFVSARRRNLLAGAAGVVAAGVAAFFVPWHVSVLLGWDVVAASFLTWFVVVVRGADQRETAMRAKADDPSRPVANLVLVAASVASLFGVGLSLIEASHASGSERVALTILAIVTVGLSWLAVNAVYTLRYADLYYATGGGIDFHQEVTPDYGDFAYVAFTIGMTYQTSDTDFTARSFRMNALRQSLLAYLFGIAIIATMVNVVATLLIR
jgi:uncharacterized membrane protein